MNDSSSRSGTNKKDPGSQNLERHRQLPRVLEAMLGPHMSEIVKGAGVALVVRVLGSLLGFAFHVILAHRLGSRGTGLFFLAMTSLVAFGLIGRMGLDVAFLRFTAAAAAVQDHGGITKTYRRVLLLVLASSTVASLGLFILATPIAKWIFGEPDLGSLLRWAAIAVLPACLYQIHAEGVRGLRKILYYQVLIGVTIPLISIPVFLATEDFGGVTSSIWARVVAICATAVLSVFLWRRSSPRKQPGESGNGTPYRQILATSIPLATLSIALFVSNRIPLVILGIWWTAEDAGILGVALRVSTLVPFGLAAANSIIAPKFAALHRQGRHRELAETARRSTWMLLLLALPLMGALMVFPGQVLAFFGRDFQGHGAVLAVLAAGQLFNVATGPAGYLLMMTGWERDTSKVAIGTAILSAILALLVIPRAGALGAAAVSAVVLAVRNIAFVVYVRTRLGVSLLGPSALPPAEQSDHDSLQ